MSTLGMTIKKESQLGDLPKPSVFLQPIAPPASFGLYGFFGSTIVLATWILKWWGTGTTDVYDFMMFNAALGGLIQFLAGVYSFRARDYISSGLLTMWGTYWVAWGLLWLLGAAGDVTLVPLSKSDPGFAIWFIPLGLATLWGSFAALSPGHGNFPLFGLLFTIGVGSLCLVVGAWTGTMWLNDIAAYLFVVGAIFAWYVASQFLLRSAWNRVILPIGKFKRDKNVPGRPSEYVSEYVLGQPGVRKGQG